jgi:phosphatidylglycerophosphatase A
LQNNGKLYRFFTLLFASGLGTGYLPIASGTMGTLIVAVPLYVLISLLPWWIYSVITLALCAMGVFLCESADRILGEKDSPKTVIDEICGFLVAMAFLPRTFTAILAGFLLFRFFDIVKLQPAKWVEDNFPGGMGILFDDVVAGIYANILVRIILYFVK